MLGGVAVYPSKDTRFVKHLVQQIHSSKNFILVITPEGTRKKVKRWKTGFYQISLETACPFFLEGLIIPINSYTLGTSLSYGNMEADLRKIQGYFRASWAKHPERYYEWPPTD